MLEILMEVRDERDIPRAISKMRQAMQNKKEGDVVKIITFNENEGKELLNKIESDVTALFNVTHKLLEVGEK